MCQLDRNALVRTLMLPLSHLSSVGGPGVPRPLAAASSSSSSARVVHLPVDEPLEIVVNSKTEDGNTDVVVTHGRPTLDGLDAADSAAAEGSAAAAATFAAAPVSWSTFDRLEHHITLNIHRDVVTAVAFSADGNTMYSCSQDSCLRVHSLKDQQQLQSTHIGDLGLSSILVLPDGDVCLTRRRGYGGVR